MVLAERALLPITEPRPVLSAGMELDVRLCTGTQLLLNFAD
jgi:hypothetical protein